MELNEKLQELRRLKGLTQEELAASLYVSRTAISKWESGRGYPSIDSLKAIARFFGVTIDELLSGNELLTVAEEDTRQKETRMRELTFGFLDCSMGLILFLPLFGQRAGELIQSVPLLSLTAVQPYLLGAYGIFVGGAVLLGLLTLALQHQSSACRTGQKQRLSLAWSAAGVLLFIISQQPYAAVFTFAFLLIKGLMLLKRP